LLALGIDPGPLDGIVGPRTTAAVQRYQELIGLSATGGPDRRMLKRLQQDPNSPILEARVK
jgi:peptidoglycan hydrolase-like protein with peptidoglycan-binding domain